MNTSQEQVIDQKYIDDVEAFFAASDFSLDDELRKKIYEYLQEGEQNNPTNVDSVITNLGVALVKALYELRSDPDLTLEFYIRYVYQGLRRINLHTALFGYLPNDYAVFRERVLRTALG